MKKVHLLLAIAMLSLVVACKKDKSDDSVRMNLITTGEWKLVALTSQPGHDVDGDGIADTDMFAFMDLCETDNLIVFKKSGEYQVDEGPTKCDPSDRQVSTSHWQFTNNDTGIIIDGDVGKIEELTTSLLVISGQLQGETYTFTYRR